MLMLEEGFLIFFVPNTFVKGPSPELPTSFRLPIRARESRWCEWPIASCRLFT